MPRFYFHVCDAAGFCEDEEGDEHSDLAAARANAVVGLRDILAGAIRSGKFNSASFIEIENEQHELVMLVSVEDAVRLTNVATRSPRKVL